MYTQVIHRGDYFILGSYKTHPRSELLNVIFDVCTVSIKTLKLIISVYWAVFRFYPCNAAKAMVFVSL